MINLSPRAFPSWSPILIPGLSLSTSGILALADLSTSAKRTALTGTSTWWDILVLVPGLHVQQRAEAMATAPKGQIPEITSNVDVQRFHVTNAATTHYLQRIYAADRGDRVPITVDVGAAPDAWSGPRRVEHSSSRSGLGKPLMMGVSGVLYALGPAMTIAAIVCMVLAQDWWGLVILMALMVARALNVYIILRRTAEIPEVSDVPNRHACWWVNLDDDHWICLRGLRRDLELITTGSWMRAQTHLEGYLEAMAKIVVYLVAVFSGNLSQAGDIILMALLICSGAVLALSNAYAGTFHMNGRTASHHGPVEEVDCPPTVNPKTGNGVGIHAEKGGGSGAGEGGKQETDTVLRSASPHDEDVNYV